MPAIGMEDIRIPTVLMTLLAIAVVYVTLLLAARKDDDQICPVCGDRRDQAPVEHWRPGSRYCPTCQRVTHRDTDAVEGVGGAHH